MDTIFKVLIGIGALGLAYIGYDYYEKYQKSTTTYQQAYQQQNQAINQYQQELTSAGQEIQYLQNAVQQLEAQQQTQPQQPQTPVLVFATPSPSSQPQIVYPAPPQISYPTSTPTPNNGIANSTPLNNTISTPSTSSSTSSSSSSITYPISTSFGTITQTPTSNQYYSKSGSIEKTSTGTTITGYLYGEAPTGINLNQQGEITAVYSPLSLSSQPPATSTPSTSSNIFSSILSGKWYNPV